MVPGQTRAVILAFPVTDDIEKLRAKEHERIENIPVDPSVIWIKQTVDLLFLSSSLSMYSEILDRKCLWHDGCITLFDECMRAFHGGSQEMT